MAVNWTEDQQKVIRLRDRSVLVSAAAGSGKTAVLVERILRRITDPEHPADIDRILVMTFTRAAAGEMRERINRALEQALYADPDNEHLQKQMTLIHAAQITTIDGFCAWVLKNYFHLIDLDPGYRMLEEGEAKLLRMDTAEELLEMEYSGKDPGFEAFVETFSPGRSDTNLPDLVLRLYDMAMSNPDPEEWLTQAEAVYRAETPEEFGRLPALRGMEEEFLRDLDAAEALLDEAADICLMPGGPHHYEDAIRSDLALTALLRSRAPEGFDALWEAFRTVTFVSYSRKRPKDVEAEKKDRVKDLRDEAKKILNGWKDEVFFCPLAKHYEAYCLTKEPVLTLIRLVRRFGELYGEKKEAKGVLDFTDLEHLTLKILRVRTEDGYGPSEAARELSEKYDEVMVDEYQDSNYLQEAIANLVSGWAKDQKNTFMVGDVKQSIYRFRLARPELFMEKYRTFSAKDAPEQRIDLHQNFRSRSQVLFGVNYLFRQLMGEDLGGITYGENEALYPGADYPAEEESTELLLMETDAEEEPEDGAEDASGGITNPRELEAHMIAQRIRELKESGKVYDRETGETRPAEYGDMVILLRSFSGWAETFRDVLSAEGIPVYVASRTGYFATTEVRTLLNYLTICDNPRQDIPLEGVLFSPIGGLAASELALLRIRFPDHLLWDSVEAFLQSEPESPEEQQLFEKLQHFRYLLERHRGMVAGTPVHQLIQTILTDTGYSLFCAALPDGSRRSANLTMLVEKAREYEHTSYRGLFNFIRYIEQLKTYEVDFGEVSTGGAGAVQVMTIHRSKGLEFPIVFVSGLGKRFNLTDTNAAVLLHPDLGIATKAFQREKRVVTGTLLRRALQRRIRSDNLGEELRVLYVAMTRAKEKLILSGTVSSLDKKLRSLSGIAGREEALLPLHSRTEARSAMDWILPALAGHRCMDELFLEQGILREKKGALHDDPSVFAVRRMNEAGLVRGAAEAGRNDREAALRLKSWDPEKVADPEIRRILNERFSWRYPESGLAEIPVKISVSELKKRSYHEEQDLEEAAAPETVPEPVIPRFMAERPEEEEALGGASRGTAYHRVMECLDYASVEDEEAIRRQIEEMVEQERLSRQQADCVRPGDIGAFVQSSLGIRMKEAARNGRLMREQPFMIERPASVLDPSWETDTPVLVQGIIDAYFMEGEDIVLVDYKTDRVDAGGEGRLIELYHVQLEDYACALERLTGRRVAESWIYSFSLAKPILLG